MILTVVSERKGKESKHQHSISLSEPLESLLEPGRFYVDYKKCFTVPTDFHEQLGTAGATLLSLTSLELQDLIADTSR